jgi:D-beta-D-heptose 7-phosphate kinase/D-beta-D-heptose 1-phosphate adenosyltransferase
MLWKRILEKINVEEALRKFREARVLVIGDLILDHFVWGKVERISPEAPVPVVEVERESKLLGGAANVAHNIRALGGQVELCGFVGDDKEGQELLEMLREKGIGLEGILINDHRPTTIKTRVIAGVQQIVRFDREKRIPLSLEEEKHIKGILRKRWGEVDCVLVSDYGKGVLTKGIMEEIRNLKRKKEKKVIVDPKIGNFHLYKGMTIMTPNTREAEAAANKSISDLETLRSVGRLIMRRLSLEALLITRGEAGMALFMPRRPVVLIPTVAKEVYDVTGAGDTVAAVLSLGLASGLDYLESAILSNCAAGVVVGKLGTAVVHPSELKHAVQLYQEESLPPSTLKE